MKGNLQLMKEINSAVILNALHDQGLLSRAELKSITRLSATTVSALVEELIAAGLVEEVGERPAAGAGRRAIALRINPSGGYVLGIALSNDKLDYAIMDMHGETVASFAERIGIGKDAILAQIEEAIAHGSDVARELKFGEMKGIGISAPGIIDEAGETMVYSVHLKLSEFPLRKLLEERYPSVPIQIANDSNAAAFAEHYKGIGAGRHHLLYLYVGEGVGSGLILHDRIFAGYKGGAGEIGHIPFIPNGKLCSCGQRGCIETELTASSLLEEGRLEAESLGRPLPETAEEVVARYEADRGAGEFRELCERRAVLIARVLATAVNLISPEVVVLAGWASGSGLLLDRIREELKGSPFAVPLTSDRLLISSYGDKGALQGAATLMLKQIFKAPSLG